MNLSITAAAATHGAAPAVITERATLTFAEIARATRDAPVPPILPANPSLATVLSIYAALDAHRPLALVHPHAAPPPPPPAVPDDTLAVLFTSGSTGAPRGVVLSRTGFLAAARMSAAHLGTADDDRWLLCLPLSHTGGLSVLLRALVHRQPLVLHEGPFDPARVAHLALAARATMASLVPTQLDALVTSGAPLPAFRAVLVGGAAASSAVLARARSIPFLTTYGMTETWGQVATQPLATAGSPDAPLVPLPGITVTAGTPDAPAPIVVDTPAAMTGYLGEPPRAGPIRTADLGYVASATHNVPRTMCHAQCATHLHVVGRVDDVIVTGGENVHPAQVEAAMVGAPGVRAACAFGVPDERWGQIVACAIVPAAGMDLDGVRAWLTRLPSHLRPRRLEVVEELPILPGGKIDRRALQRRTG